MKEYLDYIIGKVRKIYPEYKLNYNTFDYLIYIEANSSILPDKIKEIESVLGSNWGNLNSGNDKFTHYYYFENKDIEMDARTYYLKKVINE